jgi:hypothetical protein
LAHFQACPRAVYLEQMFHLFGYLKWHNWLSLVLIGWNPAFWIRQCSMTVIWKSINCTLAQQRQSWTSCLRNLMVILCWQCVLLMLIMLNVA